MIRLPAYLSARSCQETIAICHAIQETEGNVILDARGLKFVDPFGLTLLGASFHELRKWGQGIAISGLSMDVASYLQRMDLFADVDLLDCAATAGRRHNRQDALVELTCVDSRAAVNDAASRMTNALLGTVPGIDRTEAPDDMTGMTQIDRLSMPIQYVLSELLENSLTHARRAGHQAACVWVAGQYYPKNDLVRLGVTDNGCGFLATLQHHPNLRQQTHSAAILTATLPRVSCNRDLGVREDTENQGVGLTMVVRIVQRTDGNALIVSGDAYHDPRKGTGVLPAETRWQGGRSHWNCGGINSEASASTNYYQPWKGCPVSRFASSSLH